jgi:chaperonin GroES
MNPGNYNPTKLRGVVVHPQADRILVKPSVNAGKTEGGIYLPDTARGKPTEGTVVAVGEGRMTEAGVMTPMPFQPGDQVLFAAFSETAIKVDDEEFLILRVPDIYAKIEPVAEPVAADA